MTAERWLPPAALLSLLGPIVLLRAAKGLFSTGLFLLQPSSPPGGEPRRIGAYEKIMPIPHHIAP
ncbi:hypothetical protein PtA15_1A944 [Puccinia triticina]|uniref:Uncharacterized protein n=1 Tax=Puccinia triticina TaxID=208348 RepID=A0ABY7CCF7_9BASI|nr:uncharacterized protein PtA15_1A944 [Puccinia triticina]WAQ81602.1 hypothetical protein PtA15_1A944 [Puccinia triticina]